MEEDDDVLATPDLRGYLDLTNKAWAHLDSQLFKMTHSLVILDVSYNKIVAIPAEVGKLQMLREFRASFNMLTAIPPEIGKLKRLKKLILNTNKLTSIPKEVGKLEMLEELVLSENSIEDLPQNLSTMTMLRVLKLQNNKLKTIPYEIADIGTLEELNVEGNPKLEMVPKAWQGDSDSVLFICRVHRGYFFRMDELSSSNEDLVQHSQFLEEEQLNLKEEMNKLHEYCDQLKRLVPKGKLKRFEANAKVDAEVRGGEAVAGGAANTAEQQKKSGCAIM